METPSRTEPVLNETYADLLDRYGIQGLPVRNRRLRVKGMVEQGVLTTAGRSPAICGALARAAPPPAGNIR